MLSVNSARADNWQISLLRRLQKISGAGTWRRRLERMLKMESSTGIHLAVMGQPYLDRVLDGSKRLESRFSKKPMAPYGAVAAGDVVLLKAVGGPVVGIAEVAGVESCRLPDQRAVAAIRKSYANELCAEDDDEFWETRQTARFVTLITLSKVNSCEPVTCEKRDRRGWVVIRKRLR